jgi:LmbE family N-acetylglucosaminyl deacetylase
VTGRLVVVSPHLDDGVLGCSALLAQHPAAIVMTVFAGRPPASTPLPPWDEAAGFRPGDDVVGARRAEDRAALDILDAEPVWLSFLDSQYGDSPAVDAIVPALESALMDAVPATVCIPLGLFHSDHLLTHAAALHVLARHAHWRWLAYEEPMYRRVPGSLDDRLASLKSAGIAATLYQSAAPPADKPRAMACYASQLRALRTPGRPGFADALAPERYWALAA